MTSNREQYTMGYGPAATAIMAVRTAQSHAACFLPYVLTTFPCLTPSESQSIAGGRTKMFRKLIASTGLLILGLVSLAGRPHVAPDLPDLKIKQYEFVSTNDKWLRVQIANDGKRMSKPCILELAVRKINGVGATRTATETIPAIEPGKEEWVTVNTSGILQSAIRLKEDTTFRLRADETNIVIESNEDNNETWHNLN